MKNQINLTLNNGIDAPVKNKKKAIGIIIFLALLLIVAGFFLVLHRYISLPVAIVPNELKVIQKVKIEKFKNEEEFKVYLEKAALLSQGNGNDFSIARNGLALEEKAVPGAATSSPTSDLVAGRVSETNNQVKGIDELDIIKTDGKNIYFAGENQYYPLYDVSSSKIAPSINSSAKTRIINAFPPEGLKELSEIDQAGNLLFIKNILIIFAEQKIYGYDVTNKEKPEKKWEMKFNDNSSLVDARNFKDQIYLVTRSAIVTDTPCPIKPLSIAGKEMILECTDIYHPDNLVPVDTAFAAMIIDPLNGEVKNKTAFVGSTGSSVVYMSENAIYVTYSYYNSVIGFLVDFYKSAGKDLIGQTFLAKIEKLANYEISEQAKLVEFNLIFQGYLNSLGQDERLKLENDLNNKLTEYYKQHKRDLELTGIVKIDSDNLKVKANGIVPGQPLNQFALDEYQGDLRIATTIAAGGGWIPGFNLIGDSVSDVYILNKDLKNRGSVQDLGKEEKIYAARFIEDKGYIVTFKQTDPLFVLDLKNPESPKIAGELKIPGYSSYLHPITGDKILGIGEEGNQVKISLFDVSNAKKPVEVAKYLLNEYYSEIASTHHAFLLDTKHNVFFVPGGKGGYIFSYKNDQLELVKATSEVLTKRAIYLDDFLYIISEDKITVLDEKNWETVKELSFD